MHRSTDELRSLDDGLEATETELDQAAELLAPDPERDSTAEVDRAMRELRAALRAAQRVVKAARKAVNVEYELAYAAESEDEASEFA